MSSFEPYAIYWKLYGGLYALVRSLYIWLAVGLTALCFPYWLQFDPAKGERPSADLTVSMVPDLMAFTLGGMAIVLALSGGKFINALREDGDPNSLFMKLVALFFHFLIAQTIALIAGLISKTYPSSNIVAAGMFFFLAYGISSGVAIASMLLNVARVYNVTGSSEEVAEEATIDTAPKASHRP